MGKSCPGRAKDRAEDPETERKPDHTPLPTVCLPLIPREIEFLKKETAQRRVLEESELARKEEMDKLLDKVGPGCLRGRREQQVSHPVDPGWELRVMSRAGGQAGQGSSPVPSPDASPPFFQISELEGNLQTLRNSNST